MIKEIKYCGLTLEDMARAAGGRLLTCGGRAPRLICTDSREAVRDAMFVAVRGDRSDGNDYVACAFEAGASCALCERIPEGGAGGSIILVDDTVAALGRLGGELMRRVAPLSVAVTGSVGKTTTKQMLDSVLSQRFETLSTEGNYNSLIGLPMTLFGLSGSTEAVVLELGMSERGEISRLSAITRPDIAVITCIGSSHIEQLGSRDAICAAKLEIRDGMKPDGVLILNGDEPLLAGIKGAVYVSGERNRLSDYIVENVRKTGHSSRFDLRTPGMTVRDLSVPAIGAHIVFDAALAYAAGESAGLNEEQLRTGLANFKSTGLRQRISVCDGCTLIEDCYNANPESMKASLAVLGSFDGRRIAVLGDMRELGANSPAYHRETGAQAAEVCDKLFTFGALAEDIAQGAVKAGMSEDKVQRFRDLERPDLIAEAVAAEMTQGDTLLFKASRAISLERVIEAVKAAKPK